MNDDDDAPPKERQDVISYGRRIPGRDNKHFWVGIHPVLLQKKKLLRVLELQDIDPVEEDPTSEYDNEALSVALMKMSLMMDQNAAFPELPRVGVHPDAKTLTFVPGFMGPLIKELEGASTMERLVYRDAKSGEIRPVPWCIPFSKVEKDTDAMLDSAQLEDPAYHDSVSAKFFFFDTYVVDKRSHIIRTSSWVINPHHDCVVKALVDAAYMYTVLIKAAGFSVETEALFPMVTIETIPARKMHKDKSTECTVQLFAVTWVIKRFDKDDEGPPAPTPRQMAISDMVFIKEAIVAPRGTRIDPINRELVSSRAQE